MSHIASFLHGTFFTTKHLKMLLQSS